MFDPPFGFFGLTQGYSTYHALYANYRRVIATSKRFSGAIM